MTQRLGAPLRNVCLTLLLLGSVSCPALADTPTTLGKPETEANLPSPRAEMQIVLDQVVNAAVNFRGDDNKNKRREELRKIISPKFDFQEMAMRALGTHWKLVTKEEQTEFIDIFSDLLAKTYLEKIETVERNMVKIEGETLEYPKAIVRTSIRNESSVFPVNYKMLSGADGWKVYDVVIENIGLVANYRNEFAGIIRREKFSGLMKRLREKDASS